MGKPIFRAESAVTVLCHSCNRHEWFDGSWREHLVRLRCSLYRERFPVRFYGSLGFSLLKPLFIKRLPAGRDCESGCHIGFQASVDLALTILAQEVVVISQIFTSSTTA